MSMVVTLLQRCGASSNLGPIRVESLDVLCDNKLFETIFFHPCIQIPGEGKTFFLRHRPVPLQSNCHGIF